MSSSSSEPATVAKHMLVVEESGKRETLLCEVTSWTDSLNVLHGVSSKLVISRRWTLKNTIEMLPKFRLTLRGPTGDAKLIAFLKTLRKRGQAPVLILNKRGWVGYLTPHEKEVKFYCHYHYQERMDVMKRSPQVALAPPGKMGKLDVIPSGPWLWSSSSRGAWDLRKEGSLDGPDYDPALVYSSEALDPYRNMPLPPPREECPFLSDSEGEEDEEDLSRRMLRGTLPTKEPLTGIPARGTGLHGANLTDRRGVDGLSAQAEAAAKYSEELRTEGQQASSFIYHLKRFNNWVKTTLISKASKAPSNMGLRVLDLACGKGGDLGKWASHPDGVEKYVGSDIAFGSLQHLIERMTRSEKGSWAKWRKIPVKLFQADLGRNDLQRDRLQVWESTGKQSSEWQQKIPLGEGEVFDVVSMQFALHYMGQTEARMRHFLHAISRHLRVGGLFISTTMDSRVLMQLLMGHAEEQRDHPSGQSKLQVNIDDDRNNNLLSITFRDSYDSYVRGHSGEGDSCGPFGLEYTFTLRETELNKNAVDNIPEWMLPLDALKAAASDYGLDLVSAQNFHEFFTDESEEDAARSSLRNMHVFNPDGTMNKTEWRIAGIYMALVFRKSSKQIRSVRPSVPPSPPGPAPFQHAPQSPREPPSDWEGPIPKFPPASPDHPPPGWQAGGADDADADADGSLSAVNSAVPRSPKSPPSTMGERVVPQSPTSPPPDNDSDMDEMYDRALAEATNSVSPEVWRAFSSEEKKDSVERHMQQLIKASRKSPQR